MLSSRNKNNNNINFVSVETDCTTDSGVDSEPSPSSPDSDTGSGSPHPTEGSDSPFPDRTDSPQTPTTYPGDNSKPNLPERSLIDDVSKLSVQCETLRTPESTKNLNKNEIRVIMTPNTSSLQSPYNGSLSSLEPGLEDDKMETVEALLSLSDTSRSPGGSPDKTMITILPAHNPDKGMQYLISLCLQLLPSPSRNRIHLIFYVCVLVCNFSFLVLYNFAVL